jgi:subtilisin family serine protease
MKVTVNKYLNVRVGKASLNAPCYQYLAPGSELEVDGNLYKGDSYEGIDTWMKDAAGNYYWSGGIDFMPSSSQISTKSNSYSANIEELINWNEGIKQIPPEWRNTKGNNIKIAILDSGVFLNHEDLQNAIVFYDDYTKVKDNIDYTGHGTHVSGIIGARSLTTNGVIGVAPLAQLICIKVLPDSLDGSDLDNYQNIIDALDLAVKKGADIINLSFSLKRNEVDNPNDIMKITALKNKIKEIGDNNIQLIAAGGDNADLKNKNLFFPADCPEVISVSSINEGYFERNPVYSQKLNIVGPTINYLSTFKAPLYYQHFGGCSMTTAFVSGILALALSYNKSQGKERFSKYEIMEILNKYSLNLKEINYSNNKSFFFHVLNTSI